MKKQLDIKIFWNPAPPIGKYGLKPFDCFHVHVTYKLDGKLKRGVTIPIQKDMDFLKILNHVAPAITKAVERAKNKR